MIKGILYGIIYSKIIRENVFRNDERLFAELNNHHLLRISCKNLTLDLEIVHFGINISRGVSVDYLAT